MAEQPPNLASAVARLALQEYEVAAVGGLLILVLLPSWLIWYLVYLCAFVFFAGATSLMFLNYRFAPIIVLLILLGYLIWYSMWYLMFLCNLLLLKIVKDFVEDFMSRPRMEPNGKPVIIPGEKAQEKKDAGTNTSSKDFDNLCLPKDPSTEKEHNLTLISKDFEAMYNNRRFADVILKLGKNEFPAHKLILRSRSKVFEAMFEHDMQENRQDIVDLVDMEADTVKDMLRYIYCGKVRRMSPEEALKLYLAADRYDLRELFLHCRKIIFDTLSVDNLCEVFAVADLHNDQLLTDEVKFILCKNMKEIFKTDKWIRFAKENPILSSNLIRSAILKE